MVREMDSVGFLPLLAGWLAGTGLFVYVGISKGVKYKLSFKKRNLRRKGGIYVKPFLLVSQFSQVKFG